MPTNYIKINSNWKPISKIYIKISSNWKQVSQGWIKISSLWKQFFSGVDLPVIVTGPSIRLTSYSGPLAGSFESLREDLFGKDGTYTNYISISGKKFTKTSYLGGPRTTIVNTDLFTSGGGVTQSDRIGVDDQYLYYELTVSNGGTNTINPLSDPVKMIKEVPSHSVFTISGDPYINTTLTINTTIANDWYRSAELGTSYIRWYRGSSIGDTSGGNFRTTSLSSAQLTNTSTTYTGQDSYSIISSDLNQYITVKLFINNSYTRTIGNNDADGYQQAIAFTNQIQNPLIRPTSLSASNTFNDKIRLTWSGGAGDEYQGFWVTNSANRPDDQSANFDFSAGSTSPYDWTSAVRGITYYFFIRAKTGNSVTNWFPATAPGASGRAKLYAPGTPTSLSGSVISGTQINLSWTAPSTGANGPDSADGYDIYYSTSSTNPSSGTSPTTTSTSTSKSITGLTSGTTYYFWVRGTNVDNTGSNAGPWTSSIFRTTTSVPGAVRNLSYSLITGGARITWDAPSSDGGSAITRYEVKRDSFAYFSVGTATSYDYTLSSGTYTVYVRAVNAVGNGPESSISVTIPAPPTPTVNSCNVITGGRSGSSPNFTWPNPKALFSFTCSNASSADVQIEFSQFGTSWSPANVVQNVSVVSNVASIQTNQPGTNIGNYYYRATCKPYSGSGGSGTSGTQRITAAVQNTATAKNQAVSIS